MKPVFYILIVITIVFTACTRKPFDRILPSAAQDNYYQQQAERYQREVEYYTKRSDIDKAKTYMRYVENEMDKYKTYLRYASQADEKVSMYLRWAADALRKI